MKLVINYIMDCPYFGLGPVGIFDIPRRPAKLTVSIPTQINLLISNQIYNPIMRDIKNQNKLQIARHENDK